MSTCMLIFHSNTPEHTRDSYGWSIVGSLGFVLYNRLRLFSTSKHPPAGGDRGKRKNRFSLSDRTHTHTHRLRLNWSGGHSEETLWDVRYCFLIWAAACDTFLSISWAARLSHRLHNNEFQRINSWLLSISPAAQLLLTSGADNGD